MVQILDLMPLWGFFAGFAIAAVAGFVKGAVGFAMPLIILSGLSLYLEPTLAIAGLIVPTVVSNLVQAARHGWRAIVAAIVEYRRYIGIVCVMIIIGAQFVTRVAPDTYYLILGLLVTALSVVQLLGLRLVIPPERRRLGDYTVGLFAGTMGGFSGTWGPPTVLYLLALETPKHKAMLVQGVVYGLGSVMLVLGHLQSGVITWVTTGFSCMLLVPALIGQVIGMRMSDRLDPEVFRRITLVVIVIRRAQPDPPRDILTPSVCLVTPPAKHSFNLR